LDPINIAPPPRRLIKSATAVEEDVLKVRFTYSNLIEIAQPKKLQ